MSNTQKLKVVIDTEAVTKVALLWQDVDIRSGALLVRRARVLG
ncbi:hypothetical protein ACMHYJ_09965 [Castellaniella hirudinis]